MPTCGKTLTVFEKALTVFEKALTVFRPTKAQADTFEAPLHPIPILIPHSSFACINSTSPPWSKKGGAGGG
jgi:hypothetical protein